MAQKKKTQRGRLSTVRSNDLLDAQWPVSLVKCSIDSTGKFNRSRTYCYHCGKGVRDQKFCHGCGYKLDWNMRDI